MRSSLSRPVAASMELPVWRQMLRHDALSEFRACVNKHTPQYHRQMPARACAAAETESPDVTLAVVLCARESTATALPRHADPVATRTQLWPRSLERTCLVPLATETGSGSAGITAAQALAFGRDKVQAGCVRCICMIRIRAVRVPVVAKRKDRRIINQ